MPPPVTRRRFFSPRRECASAVGNRAVEYRLPRALKRFALPMQRTEFRDESTHAVHRRFPHEASARPMTAKPRQPTGPPSP